MLVCRSNPWLLALAIPACAFLLMGTQAAGQTTAGLPSAPEPQCVMHSRVEEASRLLFAHMTATMAATIPGSIDFELAASGSDSGAQGDAGPTATPAAETLTMFPHSDTARYWVSGQANSILQMHGHFRSPYEGPNSLIDDFESKASEVATLYLGYRLWPNTRYNTDLILDFENAGGRGISEALGLAGATNLDVVRNPTLSIAPYLSHGEIHQIIGLTGEMVDQERGPFALAAKVPVRRFEIRIGKMSLPDTFDVNSVGSDSHLQFTNWTIDNNGAWDYAADTRGYTVGGVLEYDDRVWSARYAIAARIGSSNCARASSRCC